ncbi:MAG: hypothetical protein KIT22_14485 [Verrucomicrobiae bacterium]|nr:hypothetical protein [Verrucomicrobiae bacterium]
MPNIRRRFEKPDTPFEKILYAQVLMQIDPADVAGADYAIGLAASADPKDFTPAYLALDSSKTNHAGVSTRLWSLFQRLDPDSEQAWLCLHTMVRQGQLREELIGVARSRMNDPRHAGQLHQLNAAWCLLRLDPQAEDGWAIFKSFLFTEIAGDPTNANLMLLSTALDYLLTLPMDPARKKALFREVTDYYDAPTSRQEHVRETVLKHLVKLDPLGTPLTFAERVRLYLD